MNMENLSSIDIENGINSLNIIDNKESQEWVQSFFENDEPYAAGFFENPHRDRFYRFAHAQQVFWENMSLPAYNGGQLYPAGRKFSSPYAVTPDFSFTFSINWELLQQKGCKGIEALRQETSLLKGKDTPHTVGGFCYTHSIPNYQRIITEGLDSYEKRVQHLKSGDFRDGLLEIIAGIRLYRDRSLALLRKADAPSRLITALEKVPFLPAENLYEAVAAWNFIYYTDGCDNPGRLDDGLFPFYQGENIENLLREFFIHVDQNDGWSSALGPDCNPLTLQCLKAIKGLRRPSLELRVTNETPYEIWEAAAEALISGCGQPAFYNETAYQTGLAERFQNIPKADLEQFNGGGCTETMLAGISNVGSLDAGINLPLIFSGYMRTALASCTNFNDFYKGLIDAIRFEVADTLDMVNEFKQTRAKVRPQPVRTLMIDDCIDKGLDFNDGGARYSWSVINLAGLVNCIDSLLAIRKLVFEDQIFSAEALIRALDAQEISFLSRLRSCPCYGVDDDDADALAAQFASDVFDALNQRTPCTGGAFLPSSIQFSTYTTAGSDIPATPDGRSYGDPLADSIGAVFGKDKEGPTAMLNSAAKLPLKLALGTPVLNIRLQKKLIFDCLKALIMGYFEQGGMQVQVSCLSREDILEAMKYPEKHENLIVRIGGFSEYFNRLSPELKQTVLKRTEFRTLN